MMSAEKLAWFQRAAASIDRTSRERLARRPGTPNSYAQKSPDLGSALCPLLAANGAFARAANFSFKVGST
jgi:hypothetical protein